MTLPRRTEHPCSRSLCRRSASRLGVVVFAALLFSACERAASPPTDPDRPFAGHRLEVFVGSATQPPLEVCASRFEAQTGARLELHFGGSGAMLSQLMLTGRGDLYIPGSSDYMALARDRDVVNPDTEVQLAYLIPAILVVPGNPKNIRTLADLANENVRFGIARPDTVCVGLYAAEVLDGAGLTAAVQPNLATQTESCAKTAQLIAMNQVDAVLGWRVFARWNPEQIEAVLLPPQTIPRIGTVPGAITRQTREPELAGAFLVYLTSAEGQAIFREHGYLISESEARALTTPDARIGGTWDLPPEWRP